jgi:hypothetical protein
MAAKPVVEVQSKGKRIIVDFSQDTWRSPTVRYDIEIDGRKVKANLFAEEVMRWMAREMSS